jgi:hypothetical protein
MWSFPPQWLAVYYIIGRNDICLVARIVARQMHKMDVARLRFPHFQASCGFRGGSPENGQISGTSCLPALREISRWQSRPAMGKAAQGEKDLLEICVLLLLVLALEGVECPMK